MGSSKRPSPPRGARSQVAHVAEIPANLEKVFVRLEASGDLDLRLLDALSGEVLLDFAERVNWCCFKPTTYAGSGASWKVRDSLFLLLLLILILLRRILILLKKKYYRLSRSLRRGRRRARACTSPMRAAR